MSRQSTPAISKAISQPLSILITLATALAGGGIFMLLHWPLPWLLGPMIAALISSNLRKQAYSWPGQIRNTGMIIVGYTIGLSLTAPALTEISRQLPAMLLMTALLLLFCAGIAVLVSKVSGTNYKTILLGSIPGGLTQMLVLAEESEDVNLTVVTVIQVIRLMMIIICIPLLIYSPLFAGHAGGADSTPLVSAAAESTGVLFPNIIYFGIACTLCGIGGQKIKFPTAFLLGPAIITAVLQISGLEGTMLPAVLTNAAQLMIGVYVGLLLDPRKLNHKLLTLSLAVGSGAVLIAGAYGFSLLFAYLESVSAATALLSLAPGGMDQMSLIAHEVGAELPTVAGFQLFRTFFIFFAVPPLFKLIFHERKRKPEAAGTKLT
ncbi:AbrB family transcriptional regulator [Paenibacillus sp. MMS20-IR301]|uniref:AbrB family transcriptional regulator n=1 Tax=Paenibacillus sp. MMS20-IR301 TaxID=2895946 RepID=UPI0028E874EE|nr:AbrB family transcriptional regulator [Paenibacillus sp. MMS20-IR301]WNS45038.1 AbrB family transcriptional regulator [Paenibacillus sp. MMS20-IR301]